MVGHHAMQGTRRGNAWTCVESFISKKNLLLQQTIRAGIARGNGFAVLVEVPLHDFYITEHATDILVRRFTGSRTIPLPLLELCSGLVARSSPDVRFSNSYAG